MPPTGAKGLNLAASDVHYLSSALVEFYQSRSSAGLDAYSARALARVWQAERFSWWMTHLLHKLPDGGPFGERVQRAELEYVASSRAAQTALAENYVGLALLEDEVFSLRSSVFGPAVCCLQQWPFPIAVPHLQDWRPETGDSS